MNSSDFNPHESRRRAAAASALAPVTSSGAADRDRIRSASDAVNAGAFKPIDFLSVQLFGFAPDRAGWAVT